MTKAKASKSKSAAKSKAPAKAAASSKSTKAAKPVKPEPKARKSVAPPAPEARARKTTPPPPQAAPVEDPAAGLNLKKKKVKRGAPPMLPRRVARKPLPPLAPGATPPPPKPTVPGSLHTAARSPEDREGLKARLMTVINELGRLRGLKRSLQKQFWEAGLILAHLSEPALYQAKGYGSWESFVEREIERELSIGRNQAEELRRIVKLFQRDAAEDLGYERLKAALKVLFPEPGNAAASPAASGS